MLEKENKQESLADENDGAENENNVMDLESQPKTVLYSKCDICEKSFKNLRGLKTHMRTHESVPQIDGNLTLVSENSELNDIDMGDTVSDNMDNATDLEETNKEEKDQVEADHVSNIIVERILLSNVASSCLIRLKPEEVEKDLVYKLEAIGSNVKSFKYRRNKFGDFDSGLAQISPINLQLIWGRRLKVDHCSIIHYNPPC